MRRWLALAAAAALLGSCRPQPRVIAGSLPTLEGGRTVDLSSCPTPKCLTIYVAPWCGVCRASTPLFKALRDYLRTRGVATRFVVGKDGLAAVRAYAADFGPDTLLDPSGSVALRGGVPQLISTGGEGRVLKTMPGVPGIYQPPFPEALLVKFARTLELF